MDEQELTRNIQAMKERIALLARRPEPDVAALSEASDETLVEIQTALEELHVAEEELRQQNNELVATRQAVEEERQRFVDLFEFAPDAYLVTDLHGAILEANQAAVELLKVAKPHLVRKPFILFIPSDQRPQFLEQLAVLGQLERPREWELTLESVRFPRLDVQVKVIPERDWKGKAVRLRWLLRDVSAARRAEQRVRTLNAELEERVRLRTRDLEAAIQSKAEALGRAQAAERRLAFLAEASSELASSLDYATTLASVARLAVPHLGECCIVNIVEEDGSIRRLAVAHVDPAQEAAMQELDQHFPLDPNDREGVAQVIRTGRPAIYPRPPHGSLADAAADSPQLQLLKDLGVQAVLMVPLIARGRTLGALAFRASEADRYGPADLALAQDLARRAAAAIDNARLYREVCEADRHKDEFLAMLAHELRNPLAPIRNALAIQRLSTGDHEATEQTRAVIERQVHQLSRLVDDLLDVSRFTRGLIELRKDRVELAFVVNRSVDDVRSLVEEHRHQLTVSMPTEPMWVEADAVRLGQVLMNLLNNAIKYTEPGGRIELQVERGDGEVAIRVRDNGIGMAPEMLPRVFDLFAQAERSLDRTQGGLGIGLTLVRKLVELHGGTVRASSPGLDKGSEFEVRLPLALGTRPSRATGILIRPIFPNVPRSGRRILVVDDNRDTAESMTMLLKLWGHEVRTAYEGQAAVAAALTERPEVVLLDIGLPGMDGYEVARQIRRQPELAKTVLVAVSGYGQEEDRINAHRAGFDYHLVKPVDMDILRHMLRGETPEA